MIELDKLTMEEAKKRYMHLTNIGDGFGEELKKLHALGNLIAFCNENSAFCFEDDDVRWGINYLLRDIAANIEAGLDKVSKEILFKIHEEAKAKEA